MKLSESTVRKSENLHFMRFVAAIMVVFAHSFPLARGKHVLDPLSQFTNDVISIGKVCVSLFFLCSGYLICRSVMRADKFIPYIKARLKRLLPPLLVVVLCSVLIGAVLTSLPKDEYFFSGQTYKYFLNAILLPVHNLPGVFENNAYNATVNGSLWTMPVEFACYVACYIFFKLGLLQKKKFWYTIPIVITVVIIKNYIPDILSKMVVPCVFFYIGMFFYVYREQINLNIKLTPIILAVLVISVIMFKQCAEIILILLLPYILFTLWFAIPQLPSWLGKTGDISYGIYLWGFFVQQTLVFLWGGRMSQLLNFLLGSAISVLLGIITFFIAEKPLIKKH